MIWQSRRDKTAWGETTSSAFVHDTHTYLYKHYYLAIITYRHEEGLAMHLDPTDTLPRPLSLRDLPSPTADYDTFLLFVPFLLRD